MDAKQWTFNFNGYKLTIKNLGYDTRQGKHRLQYYLIAPDTGYIIFQGNDFFTSPLHKPISMDSALSLMSFLTCRPSDTDDDYFKDYTPDQLRFAQSAECEQLACTISDLEEKRYKRARF